MSVVPVNPKAIYIPLIQTGCLKSELDSTYPIHLNGIISQNEFQQSINNINQTSRSRKLLIICSLIALLCLGGGMALFIVGGITSINSYARGFPLLVAVGFGIFGLVCGCCIVQSRRNIRIQQAIANESMKYSMRSPTPCSWRLDISRKWITGNARVRYALVRQLVIEIGNRNVPYQYSQPNPPSASVLPQQNNIPPPSSYYGQPAIDFCLRCRIPRQNNLTKFCTSCGHPFST